MTSSEKFMSIHTSLLSDGQRLGQRFVNYYIKNPWPELFYEENDQIALSLIRKWLQDNQYYFELPPKITR